MCGDSEWFIVRNFRSKIVLFLLMWVYFCFTILDFLELDSFVEEASEKSCK